MKQGFTLIELLVVVLIVGILTAIALPQYETVLEKARVSEAVVVMKALVDAEQRYLQANPNEPGACSRKHIADVDLKGGTWTEHGSAFPTSGTKCDSYKTKYFIYDLGDGENVVAYRTDTDNRADATYSFRFGPDTVGNKTCEPKKESEEGQTMCNFVTGL